MSALLFCILHFAFCLAALAADQVVLTVTVTNGTLSGDYLTVNGSTRRFTNGTPSPINLWVTNSASATEVTTNLYEHLRLFSFSGIRMAYGATNVLTLTANPGTAITATAATNWCTLSLATNSITDATGIRVPMSVESAALRTNLASQLVSDLSVNSTNAIAQTSTMAGELVGLTNNQTISGNKTLTGTNGLSFGSITTPTTAAADQFRLYAKTNASGYARPFIIDDAGVEYHVPIVNTNAGGIVYYNASSNAFLTDVSLNVSTASRYLAVGVITNANPWDIWLGRGAAPNTVMGDVDWISQEVGGVLPVVYARIRPWMISTNAGAEDGRMELYTQASGTATLTLNLDRGNVYVPGTLDVTNNTTLRGTLAVTGASTLTGAAAVVGGVTTPSVVATNTVNTGTLTVNTNASIAGATTIAEHRWTRYDNSSIANGANSAVALGGKSFAKLSGPTGDFSIAGIAGGADGRLAVLYNSTSETMIVLNDSGLDATAGNRIYTLTGDNVTNTGTCAVTFIYDSAASRWIMISNRD